MSFLGEEDSIFPFDCRDLLCQVGRKKNEEKPDKKNTINLVGCSELNTLRDEYYGTRRKVEDMETTMDLMISKFKDFMGYNRSVHQDLLKMKSEYEKGIELLLRFIVETKRSQSPAPH